MLAFLSTLYPHCAYLVNHLVGRFVAALELHRDWAAVRGAITCGLDVRTGLIAKPIIDIGFAQ
jgi:hypothetical protein